MSEESEHVSLLGAIFGELHCDEAFDCDKELDKHVGIIIYLLLMVYMFKALGTICDDYFVPSLEVIVEKLQLSNDVAGATFMAAGSSAPELFTSMVCTFLIESAGGVGTIVGSAIFNILVMNGVTAWIACKDSELKIWWYPLARDTSFYALSILELVLFLADEEVKWWEGSVMILTYFAYCIYMKVNPMAVRLLGIGPDEAVNEGSEGLNDGNGSWLEPVQQVGSADTPKTVSPQEPAQTLGRPNSSQGNTQGTVTNGESVDAEQKKNANWSNIVAHDNATTQPEPGATKCDDDQVAEQEPGASSSHGEERSSWCRDPLNVFWELTMPGPELGSGFALFVLAIVWIANCTYLMVDSTDRIGIILNVPPFVMGLIFLAAGTSIPDTLGSIAVAKQGEGDMAIANALGSNVFDILVGLGVPWTVRAVFFGDNVTFRDDFDDLIWDIVILVLVLVLFVVTLVLNNWKLNRRIGAVYIAFYVIFVIYQFLAVFVFKMKSEMDD